MLCCRSDQHDANGSRSARAMALQSAGVDVPARAVVQDASDSRGAASRYGGLVPLRASIRGFEFSPCVGWCWAVVCWWLISRSHDSGVDSVAWVTVWPAGLHVYGQYDHLYSVLCASWSQLRFTRFWFELHIYIVLFLISLFCDICEYYRVWTENLNITVW